MPKNIQRAHAQPASAEATYVNDSAAVAAIRPERLRVGAVGENTLAGRISAIAYHGLDLLLHIKTGIADRPVVVRMTADVADSHAPAVGQEITVSWSAKDTYIFPA